MAQTLHKPHGKNRYCGPTALSALTGLSSDDCAAVVRARDPRIRSVKGMSHLNFVGALRLLGGDVDWQCDKSGGTLAEWIATRTEAQRKLVYVVTAAHHYLIVKGELVLCSVGRREWMHILSHPYRRKTFQSAMLITRLPAKAKLPELVVTRRKVQKQIATGVDLERARAQRLAAKLGLRLERYDQYTIDIVVHNTAKLRALLRAAGKLEDQDWGEFVHTYADRGSGDGWADVMHPLQLIAASLGVSA